MNRYLSKDQNVNKHIEIISKCRNRTNTPCKVTIVWTETSDIKLRYLENFEVSGKLTHFCVEADSQELQNFSRNIKNRCILCNIYSIRIITIFQVDTLHESKEDSRPPSAVASYKKRNQYVVHLIVVVH